MSLIELALAAVCMVGFIAFNIYGQRKDRSVFCGNATVAEIGGCDRFGDCGVRLSDGRFTEMARPVVGAQCK